MARFSPDGQWIVYVTPDAGTNRLFATSTVHGGKLQLTTSSAWAPRWRRDGRAIYFFTGTHVAVELPVTPGSETLQTGKPVELFKLGSSGVSFWNSTFDALPDGKQFLAINLGDVENASGTLVLNWTSKVKK